MRPVVPMNPFPFVSLAISLIFTILLLRKSNRGRSMPHLLWSISLALISAAFLMEALAEVYGWNEIVYRIYYAATPPAVGLMGAGSLLLITRWGHVLTRYAVGMGILLAVLAAGAPLASAPGAGGNAMPAYVRAVSPLLTIPGSIALIGGALACRITKRANSFALLIAAGGMLFSVAHLYGGAAQAAALVMLLAGFMLTKRMKK